MISTVVRGLIRRAIARARAYYIRSLIRSLAITGRALELLFGFEFKVPLCGDIRPTHRLPERRRSNSASQAA